MLMFYSSVISVNHKKPGKVSFLGWCLRNQFLRQIIIKIIDMHILFYSSLSSGISMPRCL